MIESAASSFSKDDLNRFTRYVASKCPARMSRWDVDDLIGDMLVDAVTAHELTGIPLVPLAFTIAKRQRYYARAAGRAGSVLRDMIDEPPSGVRADVPLGDVADVFADPEEFTTAFELDDLIERLPHHQAAAFRLVVIDHNTLDEASEVLGFSKSTVHEHARQACRTLQSAWTGAEAA